MSYYTLSIFVNGYNIVTTNDIDNIDDFILRELARNAVDEVRTTWDVLGIPFPAPVRVIDHQEIVFDVDFV